jgi:hypothetical protein
MFCTRHDPTIVYDNGDRYYGQINQSVQQHGTGEYLQRHQRGQTKQGEYVGNWNNGKKHGGGKHQYRNGDVYDGEWVEGQKHGQGKYTYHKQSSTEYEGDWKDDVKDGAGIMTFSNGDRYEGRWKNNKMEDDNATYTYKDRSKYIGKSNLFD